MTDRAPTRSPLLPAAIHVIRAGFALSWGLGSCSHAGSDAAVLIIFTLCGRPEEDRMRLCRPHGSGACACSDPAGAFDATIAMSAEVVDSLLADASAPGVAALRAFLNSQETERVLPLTPAARLALESIRRCPFAGAFRSLALTARGNDLLIEFLTALSTSNSGRPIGLLRSMQEQIREAGERLVQRLEFPPTLAELAREVGLSETTLKRGFHQVYGTTVFGHLRALRMEHARVLLQSGEATVLEAATRVGYSNPSNFAAAFRRQFGLNPKEFQLAIRR